MSMILIILILLYAAVVLALTFVEVKEVHRTQYFLKPLAALGFCLMAMLAGALSSLYGQIILGGLIACGVGDVLLLNRRSHKVFTIGMAAFALGHIFYIFAVFFLPLGNTMSVYPMIVITVLCIQIPYLIFKSMKPHLASDMKWPVVIYTIIISVMLFFSLAKIMSPFWSVSLAALMFAISDVFVARDRFIRPDPKNAIMITPLYFGAQALFALSVGLVA